MLAMKLMAMRLDPTGSKSDLADIINLLGVVGLHTPAEGLDAANEPGTPGTAPRQTGGAISRTQY